MSPTSPRPVHGRSTRDERPDRPEKPEKYEIAFAGPPSSRLLRPSSFTLRAFLLALVALSVLLFAPSASTQAGFADPAFKATWDRTDGLVASTVVRRPWVWGPAPAASLSEPFGGIPGNSHLVQYFDKGRMEINDPNGNKSDPFYVTNGRLAVDLISGQMQTGLNTFENRGPASINLASDVDDPSAPTYQSFNGVSNIPNAPNKRTATDQTGQVARTAIDRQGITQPWPQDHPDYGVRYVHFEEATGHNIPDVFWEYLNQQTDIIQNGQQVHGPLFYPWFAVTGYPISEPYWSYVKVSGQYTDVLIQAYERRVLTFVPHLPSPFKVQMGNIGQHYYDWRYKSSGGGNPKPPVATPTILLRPTIKRVTIDAIHYRASIIDLNGNFCTITNRDQSEVSFNGWWLDSPKWDHVDRFYFPNGITLQPGASMRVHSGTGNNTTTDIYMGRTTVMWDAQPYDYAVLYDQYGRQVSDFFPAGDQGPPPTPLPGGTPPAVTPTTPPGKGTPVVQPTPTVPAPVGTQPAGVPTATVPPRPSATGQATTPTATTTGTTATPTTTRTPTATPTRGTFHQ